MIILSLITTLRFNKTYLVVNTELLNWLATSLLRYFTNKKPQQFAGAGVRWLMNYFNLINSGLTRPKLKA